MIIRDATPADAESIARVNTLAWQQAYRGVMDDTYLASIDIAQRAERTQQGIRDCHAQNCWKVAEVNGQVIGYAFGGCALPDLDGISCELKMLYVLPDYQGRGIGRALMKAFAEDMVAKNARDMIIWTLEKGPAHPFYQSSGGLPLDTTRNFKAGGKDYPTIAYHYPSLPDLITRLSPPALPLS